MTLVGQIGPAPCQCAKGNNAMWFLKEDRVACSYCPREHRMSMPPQGLIQSPCVCAKGDRAIWFITARGNYTCSYCGRER